MPIRRSSAGTGAAGGYCPLLAVLALAIQDEPVLYGMAMVRRVLHTPGIRHVRWAGSTPAGSA
jgi:hypothetical protein